MLPVLLFAQKEPIKFGKVPPEDLAMKTYEPDTSAAAVVLCDFGHAWFDLPNYNITRHKRIKILKRAGFEEGDIKIPYYGKPKDRVIENLKAKVYLPNGTEVEVGKDDFFYEKVDDFRSSINFSFPQLEVGAVIEYRYEYKTSYRFLPDWYFQSDIPHRWSELLMEVPDFLEYVSFTQGLHNNEAEGGTSNVEVTNDVKSGNYGSKVNVTRLVMKNAPAMKKEPFISTMEDYYASIKFQLRAVSIPGRTIQEEIPTWQSLAKLLVEDASFGDQYLKERNYKDAWAAAKPIVAQAGSLAQDKVNAVYKFVTDNIAVTSDEGIFVEKTLNDCFAKKAGQANEANLLVVALLREAGIEAHPMLVSRRSHGKPMTLYPYWEQFDYVLAAAKVDSTFQLLDATNPYRPPSYPHMDALNQEGWIVIKDRPTWASIVPRQASDTYLFNCAVDENGGINGKLTISSDGYSAISERDALAEKPGGDHLKSFLSDHFPDIVLDSLRFENKAELGKPLKAYMNCQVPSQAQINGDFMYLTVSGVSAFNESPFKVKKRDYPVDIPYPIKEQIVLNLSLPNGYVVEDLPDPVTLALPDEAGRFQYRVSQKGSSIQVSSTIQVNRLYFEVPDYENLYDFFSRIEAKLGEQVVLKRG